MTCKIAKTNGPGATLRRAALAGSLVLSVVLGALAGAAAQTPNDTGPNPFPYSWPGYHAGGTFPDPFLPATPGTANGPFTYTNPPNPLFSQLQGTPSGFSVLGGLTSASITEIPSFLLGNYSTVTGPSVGVTGANLNYFPNHFRDDQTILSWSSPFTFLTPASTLDTRILDDNSDTVTETYPLSTAPNTTPPTIINPTGWQVQYNDVNSTTDTWSLQSSGTADQSLANPPTTTAPDYRRVLATNGTGLATATWTFTAPTIATNPAAPGLYTVTLHLPDPDLTGAERRITDAHYVVKVGTTTVFDGRISQTETNSPQYLAGPFALTAGQVLTVTLDNSTKTNLSNIPTGSPYNYYVLADSVTLTSGAFAGAGNAISGTPTAINATQYPEIADALYYGFTITRDPNTGLASGQVDDNTNPYGNTAVGGTSYVGANGITDHAIRQLVYYGRYETIILTDAFGNLVDGKGSPVPTVNGTQTPVTEQVGAVYCVNGLNGDVVWRFQTPDQMDEAGNTTAASQAVFSTPTVARINVLVPQGTSPETYKPATKLVVIIADDNGMVYCLDALGNRNGTANSNAVVKAYNQPIYNPIAPFGAAGVGVAQGTANASIVYHVGNTNAYWIYRPNVAKDPYTKANVALPIPQAFGLASPTVYVDPNASTDPTSIAPGRISTATLATDATVYIGNSNGTLYALDALGAAVTVPATLTPTGPDAGTGDKYDTSHYAGIRSFLTPAVGTVPAGIFNYNGLPTPTPRWWFAVNGGQTNATGQTSTVSITSAPAIQQTIASGTVPPASGTLNAPIVYFTTANETNNIGRVYAIPGSGPTNATAGTTADYNNVARPTWVFPNAYTDTGTGKAQNKIRPSLGSIGGSPVVFTNPNDKTTHIYVAANSTEDEVAPADEGRIWSLNTDGTMDWAYPQANDPNDPANDAAGVTQPASPIGAFRYATPAIGIVGFPANLTYGLNGGTTYTHGDNIRANIAGQNVPMLYVGSNTEAPDASNFYALDLDGATDNQRNIFAFNQAGTPPVGFTANATGFQSSPILIVNHDATTGSAATNGPNGGSIFIAGSDNNLYQLSATFTSDAAPDNVNPSPQFPIFAIIPGFGPFCATSAASFDANTLGATVPIAPAMRVVDWVYGGNSKLGSARGISVTTQNSGGSGATGLDYGTDGPGVDSQQATLTPQQLPLHAYIFDGSQAHPGYDTNLADANKIGQALPSFEWGDPVYIRLSNVVPPNDAVLSGNKLTSNNVDRYMHDETLLAADPGHDIIYTNGGPITVQLTEIAAPGNPNALSETDSITIPTTVLSTLGDATHLPGNGFIPASGPGDFDDGAHGDVLEDSLAKRLWMAAGTYAIGDGSSRKNTPGSRRRIASATQIAQAYRHDNTNGTDTFIGSVTLQLSVDSTANAATRFGADGKPITSGLQRIPVQDQPTFGILNPLAVQAGGYPIFPPSSAGAIPIGLAGATDALGPFGAVSNTTNPTPTDLESYANGNRIPAAGYVPLNGVIAGSDRRRSARRRFVPIITATGDINHGASGDNADPVHLNSSPPTGGPGGLSPIGGSQYGPYALDVTDRSVLGLIGSQIRNLSVQPAAVQWHDSTGNNGPGAAVNPLPWESTPTSGRAGTNTSLDYPDISATHVAHTLIPNIQYQTNGGTTPAPGGELSNRTSAPDPATGSLTSRSQRTVYPDPVQVTVKVPTYQAANLQVFDNVNGQIPPDQINSVNPTFPEGYVAREFVYVDTGSRHKFQPGDAYRMIRVFTGVPVDMSTTIDTPTVDLGRLPQGFGLNTDSYPALGTFMPYPTKAQLNINAQNPGYIQFFKQLHISNRGNVNLLNVHLDQKVNRPNSALSLPLLGDSLDANARIPAYDAGDALTGPHAALPDGTAAGDGNGSFLLRSSLDSDLVTAYGHNPAIVAAAANNYPAVGATFHKARVGDSNPTTLYVPDVPHDNDINNVAVGTANRTIFTAAPPVATTTGTLIDPSGAVTSAMPFIALAIPQGTPVGTYHQSVRLFEGLDPDGYKVIAGLNPTGQYVPILPPQYGNHVVNPATQNPVGGGTPTAPSADLYNGLYNTWVLSATGSPMQPASSAAVIKATVTEARVTNGASQGELPQVDASVTGTYKGAAAPSSNFLPSAFRDPGTGNISLYWTSPASRTGSTGSPYYLVGANLSFNNGYFNNAGQTWWNPINLSGPLPTVGVNSAISVVPTGNYAFVQNASVQKGGAATPFTNNLFCYQVTPSTGDLVSGTQVLVTQNTSASTFGARGLVTTGAVFNDPLDTTKQIGSDLWAFWYGGARGRSAISYSAATANGGAPGAFGPTAVLPIPAGLVSVSDPNAVLSYAPDSSGNSVPVIEVTYTGIAADGNADIYVSRYQPYYVRDAQRNPTTQVALALLPSPAMTEALQATDGNLWWQARDVAWARTGALNIVLNNQNLLFAGGAPVPGYNNQPYKVTFDRATGLLVYTNVSSTGGAAGGSPLTIYVDLARGRIRFSPQFTGTAVPAVFATFNSQARRITTDSRADTAPISFLDEALKPNEANTAGANLGTVQANRYWFIWRKSGASGTSTTPTLYYKTQRLTVDLQLRDKTTGQPIGIQLTSAKAPNVTVSVGSTTLFSPTSTTNLADVDWVRGRIYLPAFVGTTALEGQTITVTGNDANGVPIGGAAGFSDTAHWLDEPRYNDKANPTVATGPLAGQVAINATATGDAAIPIDTIANESNVTAFLDPASNAANPHKVWLFWNSTRNGTADLYYETISPLFSATTAQ